MSGWSFLVFIGATFGFLGVLLLFLSVKGIREEWGHLATSGDIITIMVYGAGGVVFFMFSFMGIWMAAHNPAYSFPNDWGAPLLVAAVCFGLPIGLYLWSASKGTTTPIAAR